MNKHDPKHAAPHGDDKKHSHGHQKHAPGWRPHRDWRVWGVVLMLIAMAAYVLSQNEALNPAEDGEAVPAATSP
jgi:hypothetical protein